MVSLKDIAQKCGVSVATVSKALNDQSDIGQETKIKIKEVAKEMGYLPNLSARALKTNRTYNLGVLFSDESRSGLTHDYFVRVLESFKVTAEKRGYDITFLNCNNERKNRMSFLEHSKYRGFDGVVIACIDFYTKEVEELIQGDIPVVTIDHVFNNRVAIMSDNARGIEELLSYVYQQGHRKIAFIHGAASAVTQIRVSSFYRAAEKLGLEIPEEYVKEGIYRDMQAAGQRTKELLSLKNPPTCIFYPDDYSCFGGVNVIKEMGLGIPQDVSVVGFDGIPIARQIEPQLTTFSQDTFSLGKQAAEQLIRLIEKPKTTSIQQIIVPGSLFEGKSVEKIG